MTEENSSTRRQILGAALMAAAGPSIAESAPAPTQRDEPRLEFAFEARVTLANVLVVGPSTIGVRRIVPITGGTIDGPKLKGRVVPGGADWQYVRGDGAIVVEARYTLESADGALIMITNRGLRHGPPEVMTKLARGESVPPSQYYFRTVAEFEAPVSSPHEWMNRALFIGVAQREASTAIVRFFQLL